MERLSDETYIKKGPWTAEEDEVLIKHVKKNGPRDWSSIRSKGLLPRTGKSCRLRWVNKLRPNLKTGCKFSAEEERVVIELQGQFGNKWAKIATYLPGRTDNDVKNFWSTRRKRLERALETPSPLKSHKDKEKTPLLKWPLEVEEVPSFSSTLQEGPPHCNPPEPAKPNLLNLDTGLPIFEPVPFQDYPVSQLPQSEVNSQVLPKHVKIDPNELAGRNLLDTFKQHEAFDPNDLEFWNKLPSFEMGISAQNAVEGTSTSSLTDFFDDFSSEMLDYFEADPSSTGL
ncbi:hypothetical protein UlMin_026431 [Ulmus minor]